MRKIIVPRLSGWLVASVVLFALIGWTSSAQIPVVIYKLSPDESPNDFYQNH